MYDYEYGVYRKRWTNVSVVRQVNARAATRRAGTYVLVRRTLTRTRK